MVWPHRVTVITGQYPNFDARSCFGSELLRRKRQVSKVWAFHNSPRYDRYVLQEERSTRKLTEGFWGGGGGGERKHEKKRGRCYRRWGKHRSALRSHPHKWRRRGQESRNPRKVEWVENCKQYFPSNVGDGVV